MSEKSDSFSAVVRAGLFSSFSHRVRCYLETLENLTEDLEKQLGLLDLGLRTPNADLPRIVREFSDDMRAKISQVVRAAEGKQ